MSTQYLPKFGKFADWISLTKDTLKKAPLGQAEVIIQRITGISLKVEKNKVFSASEGYSQGLSIRAFNEKGGMGRVSSTINKESDIRESIEKVVSVAKLAQPDPDFKSLPFPQLGKEVKGLYDPKIVSLDRSKLSSWIVESIEEALEKESEIILKGSISAGYGESFLINTNGVEVTHKSTSIGTHFFGVLRRNNEVGSAYDFDEARLLKDFAPKGLGKKVAEKTLARLGAKSMKKGKFPVVFGPLASQGILEILTGVMEAESIQRKRSFLCGKKGKKIAPSFFSLIDDPLIPGGLGSGSCDGEGTPHKKMVLVEKGILQAYLHNSYTANKSGGENTGHATSGGGISATNLLPSLGQRTAKEIIKDIKQGIYIEASELSPHPVSGDFSQPVDFGFQIESGKITSPLHKVMIGGNFLKMLLDIEEISSDFREEPGSIMPTIKVRELLVSGED